MKEEDERKEVGWRSREAITLEVQKHSLNAKLYNKVQGLGCRGKTRVLFTSLRTETLKPEA